MKWDKLLVVVFSVVVIIAIFYSVTYLHSVAPKCPDDYATDNAGSAEYLAAMDKWTNDFYDVYPGATLSEWAAARHQFYVDNNCTAALQRYETAREGKADPLLMEPINEAIEEVLAPYTI